MENLKIKVNSIEERKEVQELFFELGFEKKSVSNHYPSWVSNFEYLNGRIERYTSEPSESWALKCKEITIDQLRDMVVLKRNNESDASHVNENTGEFYRIINGVWHVLNEKWEPSSRNQLWIRSKTKPIKEEVVKEYLEKQDDGSYKLVLRGDAIKTDDVEVPEGAEILVYWVGEIKNYFYKENSLIFKNGFWGEVGVGYKMEHILSGVVGKILWKREKPQEKCADICGDVGGADVVNHPSHYCGHPSGIECIEITRHHDFAIGNAIKYLWRAGLKDSDNEVQDLKKAAWYIQDKIKQLESKVVDDKTLDWIENLEQDT